MSDRIVINLIRHDSPLYSDRTPGHLFVDGVYVCDTLEPPVKEKYGRIPEGAYKCKVAYSPKFRRYMLFADVPGRTGIIVPHTGNSVTNTRGCVLCGDYLSGSLSRSVLAFKRLVRCLTYLAFGEFSDSLKGVDEFCEIILIVSYESF